MSRPSFDDMPPVGELALRGLWQAIIAQEPASDLPKASWQGHAFAKMEPPCDAPGLMRRILLRLLAHHQFHWSKAASISMLQAALVQALAQVEASADQATSAARGLLLALAQHGGVQNSGKGLGVVAQSYDPALQLAVLKLEDVKLEGPVLDLGCGARADLVRLMRARGLDAEGVDLVAEHPYARAESWLKFDLASRPWRTVISHLGFSLHLLALHLEGADEVLDYVRRYREILDQLAPGGVFAYAPSLPFLEAMLPTDQFRVDRSSVATGEGNEVVAALGGLQNIDFATSTRIWKLTPSRRG